MQAKKRSIGKRIFLWCLAILCTFIIAFIIYFLIIAVDHPPKIQDKSALAIKREKYGDSVYVYGNNWLRRSESGLWEMYIEGEPFERGVAFGALTRELLYYQESVFVDQIRELVPSDTYLKFLKYFTAWFNRNLDKSITKEYKEEIYGTSLFSSHEFDFIGSGYQRQLNYHAAHDIGHALQGLNMVGCTSFSCWDDKSSDSSLIVGRNFDFYAGKRFAENKIVCFVNPSTGLKFVMVTWADMIGVVSGMNEKGLTVTINASKSSIPGKAFTPISILAREILQYASTIDEAYEISKKRKLFVSESILIGSANDGKAVIIEKSPDRYDLYTSDTNNIVCSNHFQGKEFENDRRNVKNILESDSKYRFDRMKQLLSQEGKIDIKDAADILRNQKGLDNAELGMGNQLAINQLIAHHSVIFKPSYLSLWVSAAPYQLGKFVAYDLKKVLSTDISLIKNNIEIAVKDLTIAQDTFLYSREYQNFTKYLELTDSLVLYKRKFLMLPDSFEFRYINTNPDFYLTYVHLGDYFYERKEYSMAEKYYSAALSYQIPGTAIRNDLTELKNKIQKKL